jgi:uncharacterized protein (DUF1330 family)
MRSRIGRLSASLSAALLLAGGLAVSAPNESADEAPAYLVVIGKGTDRERMAAYSRSLPPVYAKAGGRYLAIGGPGRGVEWLAGPWHDRSLVLARFDSLPQVLAFWWGDDYRRAIRLRDAAGQFTVVAVPGEPDDAAGVPPPGAAYLIEAIITKDADAYAAYRSTFESVLQSHGGRTLAGGAPGGYTALEGDPLYDRLAITMFQTRAQLDAFLADPRASDLARLRDRAGLSLYARADAAAAPAAAVTAPGAADAARGPAAP